MWKIYKLFLQNKPKTLNVICFYFVYKVHLYSLGKISLDVLSEFADREQWEKEFDESYVQPVMKVCWPMKIGRECLIFNRSTEHMPKG